jgi:hypothetical protein
MDTSKLIENIKIITAAMIKSNPSLGKPINVVEQELVTDAFHEIYTILNKTSANLDSEPKSDL